MRLGRRPIYALLPRPHPRPFEGHAQALRRQPRASEGPPRSDLSRPGRCPVFRGLCPDTVCRWSAAGNKKRSRMPRTGGQRPGHPMRRRHHDRRASLSSSSRRSARSRSRSSCSRSVDCATTSSSLCPSRCPRRRCRSSNPCPEVRGLLRGFWRLLRGLRRTVRHGGGDGVRRNPPTAGRGIPPAVEVVEVAALQAPADGPLGGPQDARGLLDGVGLLGFPIHTGILPLERASVPAAETVKRRQARNRPRHK